MTLSLALYGLYGDPGYGQAKITGPYEVGFKEFTTHELYNDCSVFYPIDKDVVQKGSATVHLMRYTKSLKGMCESLVWRDGLAIGFQNIRS